MAVHKKLIAGILFLIFQLVVILVKGIPSIESSAYGIGYLVGYFATGVIGIIFLILYFKEKFGQ